MDDLLKFLSEHQFVIGMVGMWLASTALQTMPPPKEGGSAFYEWFYKFAHALGANWDKFRALKK